MAVVPKQANIGHHESQQDYSLGLEASFRRIQKYMLSSWMYVFEPATATK